MNLFGKFYYFFVLSRNIKFYVSDRSNKKIKRIQDNLIVIK